jgi:hypothetical protein
LAGYEISLSVIKHLNHGDAIHANIIRPLVYNPGVNESSLIWNQRKPPLIIRKLRGLNTNGMPKKADDQRKSSDATDRMNKLREMKDNKNPDDSSIITQMVDNVMSNNSINYNNTSIDSMSENMATGSIFTASSEPEPQNDIGNTPLFQIMSSTGSSSIFLQNNVLESSNDAVEISNVDIIASLISVDNISSGSVPNPTSIHQEHTSSDSLLNSTSILSDTVPSSLNLSHAHQLTSNQSLQISVTPSSTIMSNGFEHIPPKENILDELLQIDLLVVAQNALNNNSQPKDNSKKKKNSGLVRDTLPQSKKIKAASSKEIKKSKFNEKDPRNPAYDSYKVSFSDSLPNKGQHGNYLNMNVDDDSDIGRPILEYTDKLNHPLSEMVDKIWQHLKPEYNLNGKIHLRNSIGKYIVKNAGTHSRFNEDIMPLRKNEIMIDRITKFEWFQGFFDYFVNTIDSMVLSHPKYFDLLDLAELLNESIEVKLTEKLQLSELKRYLSVIVERFLPESDSSDRSTCPFMGRYFALDSE